MHVTHLAIAGDVIGSALQDASDSALLSGRSRDQRLKTAWLSYRTWCEAASVQDRLQRRLFTTSFLKNSRYAEINQRTMSGTAARFALLWLGSFLQGLVASVPDPPERLMWAAGVATALAGMENLMIGHGRFFDAAACRRWEEFYLVLRAGMNRLASQSLEQGLLRWHLRPKLHQLEHLSYDFLPRNPRYYHNYLGEDMVRRTKTLATRCHPQWMSRQLLFRYTLEMCLPDA